MGNKKLHLTRRIQLVIDHPVPEDRKEMLDKLYRFQNRCFRAANLIVSHLYVQEMIKDFFYLSEGIQYKLVDEKKEENGLLQRSRLNSTHRLVCDLFKGEVPTDILGSLNNTIHSTFSKNKVEYGQGIRSLRNFKRDIPIPFIPRNMSGFTYNPEKKAFTFRLFSIPFKTYLGKDFSDKRKLLMALTEGTLKLCTSQIQLKRNKIYWLAVFEMEKEEHGLKPDIILFRNKNPRYKHNSLNCKECRLCQLVFLAADKKNPNAFLQQDNPLCLLVLYLFLLHRYVY